MTVVKVKSLILTGINIRDFCIDVIWVGGFSWNEEGTRISKATVVASSVGNTSSIVDALSIASSSAVSL